MRTKILLLLGIVVPILWIDVLTKRWALSALADGRRIIVIEGFLPLTLAFNRGAAFGLSIGEDPRWVFIPVTLVAMVLLGFLIRDAEPRDFLRTASASLVFAGALGNLVDRVRWDRGVVDFIGPTNLGFAYFPIFNVADIAITCGAILLALSFWMEERRIAQAGTSSGS